MVSIGLVIIMLVLNISDRQSLTTSLIKCGDSRWSAQIFADLVEIQMNSYAVDGFKLELCILSLEIITILMVKVNSPMP